MESKVKLFGHPIHPMLIVFPLGLLATSLVFDIVHWITGNGFFSEVAYILSVVGVLLALLTGWLGGELVDRLGVGVDEGANLNASNSLSGEPARASATGMPGERRTPV